MEDLWIELSKTNLFSGIVPEELKALFNNRPYQLKQYEKELFVAHSGDICHDLLVLISGSVRGEMSEFAEKKLKIEDIAAPRPLASAFVFGKENRFPVDIIANEPSMVMIIPRDVLIGLLQKNETLLKNYLNAISSRAQFLSGKIRFLSFRTIREKVANYVLMHPRLKNNRVMLNQSRTELAEFFGVTRPSLARTLSSMEEEGLIRLERKEIILVDPDKLNTLLR